MKAAFLKHWALFNILLTLLVITLGALTRLLDAGLGCPDWPGCYGKIIPPSNSEDILQAELAHPLFPVEQLQAWAEMIHRYAASLLGLSILILTLICLKKESLRYMRLLMAVSLFWVIAQGVFGAMTVTLRIWPPVVTLHLLGGLVMLLLCYGQYQQALYKKPLELVIHKNYQQPVMLLAIMIVIQLILGGWTSAQYAGLACPDLPLCQGQIWPDTVHGPFYAPQVSGQEYLGGLLPMADRMAVQILHRLGAVLTFIAAGWLILRLWPNGHQSSAVNFILLPLIFQAAIGISNVLLLLPLPLALLHNTGAVILWICFWHLVLSGRLAYANRT
jgi:cytochrome c oxidase assembly protein subunit 15